MLVLIVIVVVLLFMMTGFHRGLLASVLHLASTFFALWLARQFYQSLSERLKLFLPFPKTQAYDVDFALAFNQPESRFDRLFAVLLIVLVVKTLMYFVLNGFEQLFINQRLGLWSRLLGASISIGSAIVVLHFILYFVALYPDSGVQAHISQSYMTQWFILKVPILSEMTLNL
ncbi:CvpA family protein [Staphylococcus sp. 17KM0847]|uniref:CvpA family protein n=1 Tax=Staphylococcus sp. 17KM0847 TaxID=2583989 RepID=UPI0015DC11B2|nr:CvpA family protein [Staphylococcus sp. 17KM0847]QLK85774.1 CvpA family protein [Staphylococcus sp. 17KM0847]